MKKWKVFLTMEFTAEVEADTEDEARDELANRIDYGGGCQSWGRIQNAKVKRYWGGANEVKAAQEFFDAVRAELEKRKENAKSISGSSGTCL